MKFGMLYRSVLVVNSLLNELVIELLTIHFIGNNYNRHFWIGLSGRCRLFHNTIRPPQARLSLYEGQLSALCSFSPVKSVCGVGIRASEARQSSQVGVYPGGWTAAWGQGPGSGTRGRGQGLSSDGIHTEDVEMDIVRGGESVLHFACRLNTPQGRRL